ncbi:PREDICTED: proline-rich protein 2-like isoform X2 [Hipposideros armiger]|uniref:Proline-rich protein 2-like isoform X2 n=1 Tax=Hipposideros armiger TaxID=186990 RepID=A0A8B7SQY8_HIPAR|nr:PREDICTED: proline-rich protein 2-like isoform X2 [Hipposideros armiger]
MAASQDHSSGPVPGPDQEPREPKPWPGPGLAWLPLQCQAFPSEPRSWAEMAGGPGLLPGSRPASQAPGQGRVAPCNHRCPGWPGQAGSPGQENGQHAALLWPEYPAGKGRMPRPPGASLDSSPIPGGQRGSKALGISLPPEAAPAQSWEEAAQLPQTTPCPGSVAPLSSCSAPPPRLPNFPAEVCSRPGPGRGSARPRDGGRARGRRKTQTEGRGPESRRGRAREPASERASAGAPARAHNGPGRGAGAGGGGDPRAPQPPQSPRDRPTPPPGPCPHGTTPGGFLPRRRGRPVPGTRGQRPPGRGPSSGFGAAHAGVRGRVQRLLPVLRQAGSRLALGLSFLHGGIGTRSGPEQSGLPHGPRLGPSCWSNLHP